MNDLFYRTIWDSAKIRFSGWLLLFIWSLVLTPFFLQSQNSRIDSWLNNHLPEIIQTHREFVSIPNDGSQPAEMLKNVDWLEAAFQKRGFQTKVLETGSMPIFFAEKEVDKAKPTVLFYFHYDGQPVAPSRWDQEHPFQPVLKKQNSSGAWEVLDWAVTQAGFDPEWRMFARAAADDKGPITMFLSAVDFLQEKELPLAFNVKVLIDGEEEKDSEGLLATLSDYASVYAADQLIIMDGPAHPSNRPTLTFGCRGITGATLTVYGAQLPQHSGHFGNYAPSPVFRMAHLLASMKDDAGRVLIEGFYDGIDLDDELRAMLATVPDDAGAIDARLGISEPEQVGENYQEALQYPSLNVKGLTSAWTGKQTRTIVPAEATAEIDIRLVPESDGNRLLNLVRKHIEEQGYYIIDREPTEEERLTYPRIATFVTQTPVKAFRTDLNSPTGKWLTGALHKMFEEEPVRIRIMGGTVPVTPLIEGLGVPAVIVPMVNMDNNQHSPNENLRVGNLFTGIKTCLAILTQKLP